MDFSLSEEQQLLQKTITSFARKELNAGVSERDREQAFPRDLWSKCGELRIPGLPVSEEDGGLGLDPLTCAIALEALGYGCRDSGLVFSLCAHLVACVVPIWKFGTPEQKRRYLPGLCDGTLIGCNAMTEAGSGSDAFAMKARAVPDGDGFRLTGTKMFISNGPVADLAVVFAITDAAKGYHGGVSVFLVDRDTRGYSVGQRFRKMGLCTSALGEIVLDDVYVPAGAVLGKVGAGPAVFNHSMDWERTCLFAAHVGTMERLIEESVEYARTRSQFGQPISKFQAVAHRVADMKVRLEASRLLVYRAASRLEKSRGVTLDAAIAKLFVSEALQETALGAVQVRGGYGYLADFEVERDLRDAVGSTLYSGTSEMQRNIIARWLGL